MISIKDIYTLPSFVDSWLSVSAHHKRYIYWFCAFGILMAFLELGQDYISAILNENYFRPAESLSYKLFWLLFIPFLMMQTYLLKKMRTSFSPTSYFAFNTLLIPVIVLVHLMIFSFILFGISNLIHEDPWSLPFLISEKLSTRLYIGLSIYIVFSAIYFLSNKRKSGESNRQNYSDTITVKNGQSTIPVDVDNIRWIRSDGPYLYIHTDNKKHVVLDSLKNIITTLPQNFKRIHRSTIVNIDKVNELKSRGNGDYDIIIDDDQMLRLSRNYAKPLKGILL